MGTEDGNSIDAILRTLESHDWSTALEGVTIAEQWCQGTIAGDPDLDVIVELNRPGFLGDLISWEDGVDGTSKSVFTGGA
jgi:hypothetical protein